MFFREFREVFKNTYFAEYVRTVASESKRYYVYIFLFEVRLEEWEEYKNYLRITSEYFDELFVLAKDDIVKWITNMRGQVTKTKAWCKNISSSFICSFIFLIFLFTYVAI